ncbi:MAG: hypothetical protein IEMM0008_0940 [bacterium]|nr:MAG: hypothetical protein IEMM0008_0940 [bacterium]
MARLEKDYDDPFLGDQFFEEDLKALVDDKIKTVLDQVTDPVSSRYRILDIKRGIRIYMDRTNKESKKLLKDHLKAIQDDRDKAIWLFIAMGRCFYDAYIELSRFLSYNNVSLKAY